MTRAEYEPAAEFMAKIGVRCPAPDEFARGGIIGSVLVVGIVTAHRSRWFRGPYPLVFADHGQRRSSQRGVRSGCSRLDQDRDQRRGVRCDGKNLPVGSVGHEAELDEKGERLIVMVGVGLGYIVTDAI
jgi:hypothetical protein